MFNWKIILRDKREKMGDKIVEKRIVFRFR